MLWVLGFLVIVVCGLTYREAKKREKLTNDIAESAERIEKLAIESEQLSKKVVEKHDKR